MRNIQLSLLSLPFGMIACFIYDHKGVSTNGFFNGYDAFVWFLVAQQAGGGLLVAVVVKYADNILKVIFFETERSFRDRDVALYNQPQDLICWPSFSKVAQIGFQNRVNIRLIELSFKRELDRSMVVRLKINSRLENKLFIATLLLFA